jgi:ABC-type transporter Mla MlaB component
VCYHGTVDAVEMHDHLGELTELVRALPPGFVLATDLSEVELIRSECVPLLREVMENLRGAGVGTVVRLIPRPERDIGFAILSVFHYSSNVHCVTCETRAEWEHSLEDERTAV